MQLLENTVNHLCFWDEVTQSRGLLFRFGLVMVCPVRLRGLLHESLVNGMEGRRISNLRHEITHLDFLRQNRLTNKQNNSMHSTMILRTGITGVNKSTVFNYLPKNLTS